MGKPKPLAAWLNAAPARVSQALGMAS